MLVFKCVRVCVCVEPRHYLHVCFILYIGVSAHVRVFEDIAFREHVVYRSLSGVCDLSAFLGG